MSDETMQDLSVATLTGSVIDNCLAIEEVIGQGGMSTVYRAHHLKLEIDVAVKVLHKHLATDVLHLKRFQLEAKAMAMLEHPHICRVQYSNEHNGCPYLVMELLQGSNLKEFMQKQNLDNQTVIAITNQIASALHYAHSQGLVHRDLKPTNVFVTDDNQGQVHIKIMDFGIARFLQTGNTKLTATNVFIGSPTYMSPEQCTTHDTDKRSDIYSLGCLIFEMLQGFPPFHGETPMELMHKHVYDPVPSLKMQDSTKERKVLEGIALKCLQKKAEDRFQDAQEITLALQRITDSGLLLSLGQSKRAPTVVLLLLAAALLGATLFLIQLPTAEIHKPELSDKLNLSNMPPYKQIDQAAEMARHPELYSPAEIDQAYQIVLQNNPKSERAFWSKANFLYGFHLAQNKQSDKALPYLQEAVAEARRSTKDEVKKSYFNYLSQLALCELDLTEVRKRQGRTREMNAYAQSAEQHANAVLKGSRDGISLQLVGNVFRCLGKPEQAKKAHGLAIILFSHSKYDGQSVSYNKLQIGHCELDRKHYKVARQRYHEAIEAVDGLDPETTARTHFDVNDFVILSYVAEGDIKSAWRVLDENSKLIRKLPLDEQPHKEMKVLFNRALISFNSHDYKQAKRYAQEYQAKLSTVSGMENEPATPHINYILVMSQKKLAEK